MTLMSNLNHSIKVGAERFLKTDPNNWGRHAGWDFNGILHYKEGKFTEAVYQYHSLSGTVEADSLLELMEKVNNEYGWN